MNTLKPRAWVGCLGCYNGGRLVGEWFDGADIPTDMPAFERAVLRGATPRDHIVEAHEELWVMDHEEYGPFLKGECSPVTAARLAEAIAAITGDGKPLGAVAAWADYVGEPLREWDAPTCGAFEDAYRGEWDSLREYVQEYAEETCGRKVFEQWPYDSIDWNAAAESFGDVWTAPAPNGAVYVFDV